MWPINQIIRVHLLSKYIAGYIYQQAFLFNQQIVLSLPNMRIRFKVLNTDTRLDQSHRGTSFCQPITAVFSEFACSAAERYFKEKCK